MKDLYQIENGNLDGIIGTEKKLTNGECVNTTNEKKWTRNCPKCNKELNCESKWYRDISIKLNRLCRDCSPLRKKKLVIPLNGWKRNCPECGGEIFHTQKHSKDRLERSKSLCHKCCQKGNKSVGFGKHLSDEIKKKISISNGGENCYWFGKTLSEETKEKLRKSKIGTVMHPNTRKGIIAANIGNKHRRGKLHTEESKRKMRLAIIKRLQSQFGFIFPNFNLNACEYFQWLNMWNGWKGRYAFNGGEYFIKDLGYWVDYYEPNENVVIEWDEKQHYDVNGMLKKKDLDRMNEIKNHLKCKFMRFNEKLNELKEY